MRLSFYRWLMVGVMDLDGGNLASTSIPTTLMMSRTNPCVIVRNRGSTTGSSAGHIASGGRRRNRDGRVISLGFMVDNRTCRLKRLIWTLDTGHRATDGEGNDLVKSELFTVLMDTSSQNVGRLTLPLAMVVKFRLKILSILTAGFHQSFGLSLHMPCVARMQSQMTLLWTWFDSQVVGKKQGNSCGTGRTRLRTGEAVYRVGQPRPLLGKAILRG
jgi:hypothetical protein